MFAGDTLIIVAFLNGSVLDVALTKCMCFAVKFVERFCVEH